MAIFAYFSRFRIFNVKKPHFYLNLKYTLPKVLLFEFPEIPESKLEPQKNPEKHEKTTFFASFFHKSHFTTVTLAKSVFGYFTKKN